MELRVVVTWKNIRNLEFAGEDKTRWKNQLGRMAVLSRSFNLYSDVRGG